MYTVQGFLVYSQDLQSSPLSQIPEHVIIHPPPQQIQKPTFPLAVTVIPSSEETLQPLIYFLSLQICVFTYISQPS